MIEIIDCAQGSPQWLQARAGVPTASKFAALLNGRGADSRMRHDYLLRLAGEIVTGELAENFSNGHTVRGRAMEQEATDLYAFICDQDPQPVGFIRNGRKGCSPDGLVGVAGLLEVKTKLPHLAIECLIRGEFPPEHKAQCQGELWIAEREWIDLVVYWPKLPLFVLRAYRDEAYITRLGEAVERANEEVDAIVTYLRKLGAEPAAPPAAQQPAHRPRRVTPRRLALWMGTTANTAVPPRVKLRVFDRAGGSCELCHRGLGAADNWEVDHKLALINGGANREDNLQCLCEWCHATKTGEDIAQKAKSDRIRMRHLGIRAPRKTFASRSSFRPNRSKARDIK